MDFSPSPRDSLATLTAVETRRTTPSHSHVSDNEHADFQSTEGFRTPTKDLQHTPTTPYYSDFGASKSGYSGDRLSDVGSSLTTGIARDSTYLLPTTDRKKNRFIPLALRLPIAVGVPLSMVLLAIALEVGIALSRKHNGFHVPTQNFLSFASAQFLLSFVPTMFVIPPGWVYRELDWHVRWYQPYVIMSRGNARPEESVLLDYVTLGPVFSVINSAKFKHRVITWSTLTALATYILQPLAGSIFQLQNLSQSEPYNITGTRVVGNSDFPNLTVFVSSAGFVEASVFNGLPNPTFIMDGWATAQFQFPSESYLNATLYLNTMGIQSNPNCSVPTDPPVFETFANSSLNINSTSADGCTVTAPTLPTNTSRLQYGVVALPSTCSSLNITQAPVMFWFLNVAADGTKQASTVFCQPTIQALNVEATVNLNNNSLTTVTLLQNASNDALLGKFANAPLNGVIFESYTDFFLQAKANAVQNGVPGAIIQLAAQSGGIEAAFDQSNPFLDYTTSVYKLYLALVAESAYFVPQQYSLNAQMRSISLRLTINPLPGHSLAIFLLFIGITGAIVHIISRRQRRGLYLSTPPGTIAATIGMSSHSGFGELLRPSDDEAMLERKLSDLRFSIDKRTGAIVATPAGTGPNSARETKRMSKKTARDEAMESLLGGKQTPSEMGMVDLGLSESSSQAAFEAAVAQASYPPMRSSLKSSYQ